MSELSYKWGVHALHVNECHTLKTFIIGFWAQRGSVTTAPAYSASDHIISDSICYCYCCPIYRGGILLEWHTPIYGTTVAVTNGITNYMITCWKCGRRSHRSPLWPKSDDQFFRVWYPFTRKACIPHSQDSSLTLHDYLLTPDPLSIPSAIIKS